MQVSDIDPLKAEIDELVPDLVAMRRDLHEHPELAFEEVRTSAIVAGRLRALGMEVQTGIAQTGVVGLLHGEASGANAKTIALRADMDALPIQEQNEIDYRSQVDGKMHACGHDGHTSILLTVADILSKHRGELKGNVKFIFQPAEERIGGAQPMVQAGIMEGVDGVIGLHLISNYPLGRVGVREGTVFASADIITWQVHGKGGHAASPHEAVDPILIAAHLTIALQTLISRETSPLEPAVITVGTIQGGTAFNIIPETVTMHGTMRAFSQAHREKLLMRIQAVSQGIATSLGGSCSIEFEEGVPPCTNDPVMTELVHRAAAEAVGEQEVDSSVEVLSTGSDDMSHFLNAAPGCYFIVGAHNPENGAAFPHHHPQFAIDEGSLPIGAEVLTRAALAFLEA